MWIRLQSNPDKYRFWSVYFTFSDIPQRHFPNSGILFPWVQLTVSFRKYENFNYNSKSTNKTQREKEIERKEKEGTKKREKKSLKKWFPIFNPTNRK